MLTVIILAVYMVAMLAIGFYLKDKIDTSRDYYVAGRALPWYLVIMTMAATYIGAGATLADTGLSYDLGMQEFVSTIVTMAAMFLFGFVSPRISRIGFKYDIVSVSGLISWRFGKFMGVCSAIVVMWALTGTLSGQVSGAATVIPLIFNEVGVHVSYGIAATIMVAVMVAYTVMAGMFGVAWTDFIQCIILLIGMAIILPAVLFGQVEGGMSNLPNLLPEGFLSLKPGAYVISLSVSYLCYFFAGPPYWQRTFSSDKPETARIGAVGGVCVILFYSIMVMLLGVVARAILPVKPDGLESQGVVVHLMIQHCPAIISAIVCCAILAAIMSTMSSYLLTAVQALITDIIKAFITLTDEAEIKLARWLVVLVGAACLAVALWVKTILAVLLMAWGFYSATMAASVAGATFWRKATTAGSFASLFGGLIIYFFQYATGVAPWGLDPTVVAAVCSILLMIIVSLITYPKHPAPFFEGVSKHDGIVRKADLPEEETKGRVDVWF